MILPQVTQSKQMRLIHVMRDIQMKCTCTLVDKTSVDNLINLLAYGILLYPLMISISIECGRRKFSSSFILETKEF